MERETFRKTLGLPKLELPPHSLLHLRNMSDEKRVFDRIEKLREEIGPIDMTLEELMAYDEDQDEDDG